MVSLGARSVAQLPSFWVSVGVDCDITGVNRGHQLHGTRDITPSFQFVRVLKWNSDVGRDEMWQCSIVRMWGGSFVTLLVMGGPGGGVEGEYNYYCGNLVFLFCMSFIIIHVNLLLDGINACCEYKIGLFKIVVNLSSFRPNGEWKSKHSVDKCCPSCLNFSRCVFWSPLDLCSPASGVCICNSDADCWWIHYNTG